MAVDPYWNLLELPPSHRLVFSSVTALADSLSAFSRRETRVAAIVFSSQGEPEVFDPYRLLTSLGTLDPWLSEPLCEGANWGSYDINERLFAIKSGLRPACRIVLVAESPAELVNSCLWTRRLRSAATEIEIGLHRLEYSEERLAVELTPMAIASGNRRAVEELIQNAGEAAQRTDPLILRLATERALRLAEQLSLAREEGRRITGRIACRVSRESPAPTVDIGFVDDEDTKLVGKLLLAAMADHDLVLTNFELARGPTHGYRPQADAHPSDIILEFREDGDAVARRHDSYYYGVYRAGRLFAVSATTEVGALCLALQEHANPQGWNLALLRFVRRVLQRSQHGCSIVIQGGPNEEGAEVLGQAIDPWQQVFREDVADMAVAMGSVDGALAVSGDGHLRGFGCLLDGIRSNREVRARGSRFNSAVRYSEAHPDVAVVVSSADGAVSLLVGGEERYPCRAFRHPRLVMEGVDYLSEVMVLSDLGGTTDGA